MARFPSRWIGISSTRFPSPPASTFRRCFVLQKTNLFDGVRQSPRYSVCSVTEKEKMGKTRVRIEEGSHCLCLSTS
ncbi:unnamed protein product [Linum tenue]|uniref:Uncharacterized protein n=1 Tax=Linum tenue TaxID=586396 RepID=A0AAV0KL35_9ROSI|nr:unnamed protein product [Linum tenue]